MRRLFLACAVLVSCLCGFSPPVFAQAVLPGTPTEEPPQPTWSGKIEFSFVSASGNSSARTLGAAGELDYHPDGWQITSRESFIRSTSDALVTAQSISSESRVSHHIAPRVDGYGQLDFLANRFAGIDSRVATDGGLAWDLLTNPHGQTLQVTAGLGYSHENNLDDGTKAFATGNTGVQYVWHLSKTATISEDGLFTASLVSRPDWRARNTLAVSAALNSIFSLKLSHRIDFVNEPVPGFRKTDQLTSAAIVASF